MENPGEYGEIWELYGKYRKMKGLRRATLLIWRQPAIEMPCYKLETKKNSISGSKMNRFGIQLRLIVEVVAPNIDHQLCQSGRFGRPGHSLHQWLPSWQGHPMAMLASKQPPIGRFPPTL